MNTSLFENRKTDNRKSGIFSHRAGVSREHGISEVKNIVNTCRIFKTGTESYLDCNNGFVGIEIKDSLFGDNFFKERPRGTGENR